MKIDLARLLSLSLIVYVIAGFTASYGKAAKAPPKNGETFVVRSEPGYIAIDASGNVWVTSYRQGGDWDGVVTKLSPTGRILGTFRVGMMTTGIAIDASENVWVTNDFGGTVSKLSSAGKILGTFRVGARPTGIAIDALGNVWVACSQSNYVAKLSPSGKILGNFGNFTPPFYIPIGIAIDAFGNVLVADDGEKRIVKLSFLGKILDMFAVTGFPNSVIIDPSGNVWVTAEAVKGSEDSGINGIIKIKPSGKSLATFVGVYGSIAIDASGNVWVADYKKNRVVKLNSFGRLLDTFTIANPHNIAIDASGNVWVTTSNGVTKFNGVAKGPEFFPYKGPQWPYSF